jgi:hypothetical protein
MRHMRGTIRHMRGTARHLRENTVRHLRGNNKASKALAAFGALAALAGGSVALSGCGASATLDPIARAAEVSSQQSGAQIAMRMQFSGAALPGSSMTITAQGSIDEREKSGEMTMNLSGVPGIASLPGGGSSIQVIYQFPVIYMNMPFLAGKLPEGKTWMKLDLSQAAKSAGIDLSQFSSIGQNDPSQFLSYLRASSGAVVSLGSEKVDGVATTHYSATLQLSHILEHLPGNQQAAAKAALEQLGSSTSGMGGIPANVWVDGQGRVRRMQMSFGGSAASTGAPAGIGGAASAAGISGSITIDYKSYGAVPAIVPPPASQVFDASSLAAGGIQSGTGG